MGNRTTLSEAAALSWRICLHEAKKRGQANMELGQNMYANWKTKLTLRGRTFVVHLVISRGCIWGGKKRGRTSGLRYVRCGMRGVTPSTWVMDGLAVVHGSGNGSGDLGIASSTLMVPCCGRSSCCWCRTDVWAGRSLNTGRHGHHFILWEIIWSLLRFQDL